MTKGPEKAEPGVARRRAGAPSPDGEQVIDADVGSQAAAPRWRPNPGCQTAEMPMSAFVVRAPRNGAGRQRSNPVGILIHDMVCIANLQDATKLIPVQRDSTVVLSRAVRAAVRAEALTQPLAVMAALPMAGRRRGGRSRILREVRSAWVWSLPHRGRGRRGQPFPQRGMVPLSAAWRVHLMTALLWPDAAVVAVGAAARAATTANAGRCSCTVGGSASGSCRRRGAGTDNCQRQSRRTGIFCQRRKNRVDCIR
jgi:hypothetical protein